MKRIILVLLFASMLLAGCSRKGECDECGQIEKLNKFVAYDGDVFYYCDDCYRIAKLFQ